MPNRPEKFFYTEKIFIESEFEEFENPRGDYESKEDDVPHHDNEPGETGPDDGECLVDFNVFDNIRFDEEPEVEETNKPEIEGKTISFIGDGTTITLLPLLPTNSVEHQTMSFSSILQFELHVFKTSKEPKSAVYDEELVQPGQMNAKFETPWGDYKSKEDDVPDHDNEPREIGPDDGECLVDFNVFDNIRFNEDPEVVESNEPETERKTISFIGDGTTITLLPLLPTNSVEHQTMSFSSLLQFELHVFKTSKEPRSVVYDEEPVQPAQMNYKRDNHLTPPRSVYEDENHKLSCLGKFPTIKSNPSSPKPIVCVMPNRPEKFFYTEKIFTESEFEEFENPYGDYESKEDDVPDHDNEPGETGPDDGECLVDFNVFDNIRFDEEPEVEESNKPEAEGKAISFIGDGTTITSFPLLPTNIVEHQTIAMPNRPEKFFYTEKIFTESEFEEFENPRGDYESKEDDVPHHDNEPGETGPDDGECLVDFNVFDNIRFDEEPEVEESNKPEIEGKTISFIGDGTTITLLPLLPTNSVEHQTMSFSSILQFELHVFKTSKEPKSAVYDEEPVQPFPTIKSNPSFPKPIVCAMPNRPEKFYYTEKIFTEYEIEEFENPWGDYESKEDDVPDHDNEPGETGPDDGECLVDFNVFDNIRFDEEPRG
ncbi:hypothetical protein L1987_27745 [Smallanthus sonchifolius]|uniref:Uncharacterized protein n=1 Tax=Smallanthus sonchifolius TaxID=185202 RepID=A0ACB9ID44_9ASTR|nr:hypothetical protein L1987_27745 [Smallanthus sonchifolius]